MDLRKTLVELSHEFGGFDCVKCAGGNTSAKNNDSLWIKPSGTLLCELTRDSFIEVDRAAIAGVFSIDPDGEAQERENQVKTVLQQASRSSTNGARPSVETPMHNLIDYTFVVHIHPPLVNGMLCARDSEPVCRELFPQHLYIEYRDPGYRLCVTLRDEVAAFREKHGAQPTAIFMANHGIVAAGNTEDDVRHTLDHVMRTLTDSYQEVNIVTEVECGLPPGQEYINSITDIFSSACGPENAAHVVSCGPLTLAEGPLTPDHLLYMKAFPFVGEPTVAALSEFVKQNCFVPRVISAERGILCFGPTEKAVDFAMQTVLDGALIIQLTGAFGGTRYLDDRSRSFIENWEAEAYRNKLSTA